MSFNAYALANDEGCLIRGDGSTDVDKPFVCSYEMKLTNPPQFRICFSTLRIGLESYNGIIKGTVGVRESLSTFAQNIGKYLMDCSIFRKVIDVNYFPWTSTLPISQRTWNEAQYMHLLLKQNVTVKNG